MAYVCYDCQKIFSSQKSNCPFCGGKIYSDAESYSSLQSEGFTLSDIKTVPNDPNTDSSDDFHIDDSDILSSLRQSYDKEHRRANRNNNNVTTSAEHNTIPDSILQSSPHAMPEISKTSVAVTPPTDDFFSQFQTSTTSPANIPTVGSPSENSIVPASSLDDEFESKLQSIERQQRRIRNNYRRLSILNFFSNVNWQTVFRIIALISIVLGLLAIWKMRYRILDSLLNFIIALIPLVILIWIIVSIFKALFK